MTSSNAGKRRGIRGWILAACAGCAVAGGATGGGQGSFVSLGALLALGLTLRRRGAR